MAFSPVSVIASNYRDFSGYFLKAYEPGTTTPKTMAIDADGNGSAAKFELNVNSFFVTSGGAIVNPHVDGAYDLWLFPTEAEADANDTVNAKMLADDLSGIVTGSGQLVNVLSRDTLNDAVIDASLQDGLSINLKERTTGNGGGALWDVVLASSVTPNTFNIVICTGVPTLALVLRTEGRINVKECGAMGDDIDEASNIQSIVDLFPNNDLFFPAGVYRVEPTSNAGAIFIGSVNTALYGEAGTVFTGDTTVGALLTYRASGDNVGLNRNTARGIYNISFKGEWEYTPGVTDVNNHTYLFLSGEGMLLSVGHDEIPIRGCSFYNSPLLLQYESAARVISGTTPHVYGGMLDDCRMSTAMYGVLFRADDSFNGQYVGSIRLSNMFIGNIFKAAFASTGKVVELQIDLPTFENVTMLHAHFDNFTNIKYGLGHYELGWSSANLDAQQIAKTLDFRDIFGSTDVRYAAIPVWDVIDAANTYLFYGYADHSKPDRAGSITYNTYNKPIFFDRNVQAIVDVKDDTNNFSDRSVIDQTSIGAGSGLYINTFESEKSSGGVTVFNQPITSPFTMEGQGQMLRTQSYINPTTEYESVALAPLSLGGNSSGINPSALPADGVLINSCQEFTLDANGGGTDNIIFGYNSGYTPTINNLYVLYSCAIKVVSTSDSEPALLAFDNINNTNTAGIIEPDGQWKTYSLMVSGGDAQRFDVKNTGDNTVTFRITDRQAVKFNSLTELNSYVASRSFALGRDELDADKDYIQSVRVLDNGGVEVTTSYEWIASASDKKVWSNTNSGDYVGAPFEIERMEVRVISGTPVSIDIGSPTVSGTYYLSGLTPSGSDWVDITLANTRPPNATVAGSRLTINPSGSGTVVLEFRTNIRYL